MKSASENSRGPALLKAEPLLDVRQLSDVQFRSLGLQQVAYMRPATMEDGDEGCAIYAADGSLLAVVEDMETAWGAIMQNDMVPASLQ
ncbi:hypothetical protein OQ496_02830 [Acetobacter suratthaniensis]|uniref:DUF1150 domain-containing protein n=1 Tax=Acetobacter suratthaniensis TaxID=1502841 RepID=A0ABS3LJ21_9PROT|nr:hypothetical protein [Acetobacter suratthaniensis]MBO1327000.1 hypothetical protein [Acetobacter suratthaniensis]MCX2565390.1 hypothetical protein [Acetobacter suratthaniensis]